MPRKLLRTRIAREPGTIDYVDAAGHVCRAAAPGRARSRARVLVRAAVQREPGYLYYIDRDGDVARAPLAHPDLRPD